MPPQSPLIASLALGPTQAAPLVRSLPHDLWSPKISHRAPHFLVGLTTGEGLYHKNWASLMFEVVYCLNLTPTGALYVPMPKHPKFNSLFH